MQHASRSSEDSDADAQIFVLRIPGSEAAAELEHVNAGVLTQHGTLQDAFGQITAIVDPASSRNRRH